MLIDTVVIWNLDPVAFSAGNFIAVRWYGLLFAIGVVSAYLIMQWFAKHEKVDIDFDKLLIILIISVIVGARLFHVLYEPSQFRNDLWKVFKFWEGGLASHGGVIGLVVGTLIFVKSTADSRVTFGWVMDRLSVAGTLTGAFIRLGNFANSEVVGKVTDVSWAVVFNRYQDNLPRHPVQLYESLSYALIALLLLVLYKRTNIKKHSGLMFSILLIVLFSMRFILENYKQPIAEYADRMVITLGQLSSIPFVFLGLVAMIVILAKAKRAGQQNNSG